MWLLEICSVNAPDFPRKSTTLGAYAGGSLTEIFHLAMSEDLVLSAREGDITPFQEFFKQQGAREKFLNIENEVSKSTPLHMAAANGHTELVKLILDNIEESERKQYVNKPNDHGNTALHWACLVGVLDCVKLLVEAGADPMIQNESGKDSVFQAESAGHEEIIDYLLSVVDVEPPQELDEADEDAVNQA